MIYTIHLVYKSDIYAELNDFIDRKRKDYRFNWMKDHEFMKELYLDRDSTWFNSKDWEASIVKPFGINCVYSDPANKNSNAQSELAVKAVERMTKKAMLGRNLPPEDFVEACNEGCWLAARLSSSSTALDGNNPRPLEVATNGQISREQIDKQLSIFVGIGTPCLVWNPVQNKIDKKGSDITSKARWGIAWGMNGKSVRFKCPYTQSIFYGATYLSMNLDDGVNYYQFLGIKSPPLAHTTHIPRKQDTKIYVTLPEYVDKPDVAPLPVNEVIKSGEPNAMVQLLDSNGRIFQPNEQGEIVNTGHNVYNELDNNEKGGILGDLSKRGIIKDGWNGHKNEENEYNYQIMLLTHRPKEFCGKFFKKQFDDGIFQGHIKSYNKKTKMWKVQYEDDDHEEFDMQQIITHVIEHKTEVQEKTQQPVASTFTDPALNDGNDHNKDDENENEPMRNSKQNDTNKDTDETTTSEGDDDAGTTNNDETPHKEPTNIRQDFTLYSLSTEKATRFQTLPRKNERGEHPPSMDFFGAVKRRVTYNTHTNEVIEDAEIHELEESGERNRLPPGVSSIQTHFYFLRDAIQSKVATKYTSVRGDNLKNVLKQLGMRQEFGKSYLAYLPDEFIEEAKLPMSSATPYKANKMQFKPGYSFEYPQGRKWNDIRSQFFHRQRILNPEWKNRQLAEQAVHDEQKLLKLQKALRLQTSTDSESCLTHAEAHNFYARMAHAKANMAHKMAQRLRIKKNASVKIMIALANNVTAESPTPEPPIHTIWEALASPRGIEWMEALIKEDKALDSLEVFLHDQTKTQLKALGITEQFIIPSRYVPTLKTHPDGTFDKLKIRKILQGHQWAMKKGIHYDETFTTTPTHDSARILQALGTGHGWHRYTFDIKSAYQQAPATGPKLGVRYPKGFERYDPKTKEELFAVLKANLNGKADASRQWGQYRDKWILSYFNTNGYACTQSLRDPCVFTIICPHKHTTHLTIHSDDVDSLGENLSSTILIGNAFDKKWGIKVTNPEFMLGILRKRYTANNVLFTHLTQTQYLEDLYASFSEHLPNSPRLRSTPFPPGKRLYIGCEDATAMQIREIKDKGYMKLTGALLWCARCTGPTVSYAVNQLCKVMSNPGPQAWEHALHVLQYAYDNRHEGILYRSDGNTHPISYYDASFGPDPTDGKCTYGYSTHLFGGPVSWLSKKLPHVGTHVGQNETAAQCFGGKQTVWIKYLIEEIQQNEMLPIPLLGDNDQATRLSQEDMMTSGNKCYYTPYYWTKEVNNVLIQTGRVDTKENVSDILTKAADKATCDKLHPRMTGHTGCEGTLFTFDPLAAKYCP